MEIDISPIVAVLMGVFAPHLKSLKEDFENKIKSMPKTLVKLLRDLMGDEIKQEGIPTTKDEFEALLEQKSDGDKASILETALKQMKLADDCRSIELNFKAADECILSSYTGERFTYICQIYFHEVFSDWIVSEYTQRRIKLLEHIKTHCQFRKLYYVLEMTAGPRFEMYRHQLLRKRESRE